MDVCGSSSTSCNRISPQAKDVKSTHQQSEINFVVFNFVPGGLRFFRRPKKKEVYAGTSQLGTRGGAGARGGASWGVDKYRGAVAL